MYLKRLYRAKNVSRRTYTNSSTKFIFNRFWGSKTTIDIETAKWGSKNRFSYMPSSKIKLFIFINNRRYINIFKNLHEYILFVYKKDNLKIDTNRQKLNVVFFYVQCLFTLCIEKKALFIEKKSLFFLRCIYRVK